MLPCIFLKTVLKFTAVFYLVSIGLPGACFPELLGGSWGSCFCLLACIPVPNVHPLGVFLLLQQELRSVVQFLNDLISSTFPFFL